MGVLQERVAIVTGTSSGLGREIAMRFPGEGAIVYGIARRTHLLAQVAETCRDLPGKFHPLTADLLDLKAIPGMVDAIAAKEGRIDILINNAGVADTLEAADKMDVDYWDKIMRIDLYSYFYFIKSVLKYMLRDGKGAIVNMSSVGGITGGRSGVAYVTAKHAIVGLTRHTAYAFAKRNIRCNAICPGIIDGCDHVNTMGLTPDQINKEGVDQLAGGMWNIPRLGQPSEIASTALFLASDAGSFVNGVIMPVDGGWTCY